MIDLLPPRGWTCDLRQAFVGEFYEKEAVSSQWEAKRLKTWSCLRPDFHTSVSPAERNLLTVS